MTFPFPFISTIAKLPTFSYRTNAVSTTNANTYTFSTQDIGTASATRFVIVVVACRSGNLISSVTLGGNAMTLLQASRAGDSSMNSNIYGLAYPSNTTDTVVVNCTTSTACGIGIYALYGLASTTPATSTNDNVDHSPISLNVNTTSGSIVIGFIGGEGSQTVAWTGLTENFDVQIEAAAATMSGASDQMVAAETPRTISGTLTGKNNPSGAVVVMR